MRGKALCACRAVRGIACVSAASVALAFPVSVASAAGTRHTVAQTSVVSTRVWTDTGVQLRRGDLVAVRAAGQVHFIGRSIDRIAPAGIPWGKSCTERSNRAKGWPAPGLACWSLIARIGSQPPFEIGAAKTFGAVRGGELFLGVNDNDLSDNSGAWSATVSVTPVPAAAASKKSSTTVALIALIVAALLALAALFALVTRRRRAGAGSASAPRPPAAEVPAMVPAAAGAPDISADILPEPRAQPGSAPVVRSAESDSTDVNIFEVEFIDPESLRVGYNYFPDGTVLRWRVRQDATMAATGEFVAEGGGSTNHFVTIRLGRPLEASPDGADVDFTWSVGGVPFGYSVRRAPRA